MDPVSPETKFMVELQAQQWNVVLAALQEMPYRIAAPLVMEINRQVQLAQLMMASPLSQPEPELEPQAP